MTPKPEGNALLSEVSPAGSYVAIRIRFAFPLFEDNRFPDAWVNEYTANGFMLFDPVVKWMYQNTGTSTWSALQADDALGILPAAQSYGMHFGTVISLLDSDTGERSYGSFARGDREHTPDECARLRSYIEELHTAKTRPSALTDAETEALRFVRDGMRFKQIAYILGISESAVKARLTNAKRKLKARTSVQAVAIASEHGLL